MLQRLADVVVTLKKQKEGRAFLRVTDLGVLGQEFDRVLAAAGKKKAVAASKKPAKRRG